MTTYKQARADFEYLETLAECHDQVEIQGDIESLLRTPTKAKAKDFYERLIELWVDERKYESTLQDAPDFVEIAPRVKRIAKRYNCEIDFGGSK